jgi:hypothetical protein
MSRTARSWIVRMIAVAAFWVLLGAGRYVQAGPVVVALTLQAIPSPPNPADANPAYNGQWLFSITTAPTMVTLTVVSGPTAGLTTTYKGDTYAYTATVNMGVYNFSGTSFSTLQPNNPYNLGLAGSFNSKTSVLTLGDSPASYPNTPAKTSNGTPIVGTLTSQHFFRRTGKADGKVYEYYVIKIQTVPEPSSAGLSLFALGTLIGSSTLTGLLKRTTARIRARRSSSLLQPQPSIADQNP